MRALLPLMRGTIDNLSVQGLPNGLNGPMRRGDAATVARHLVAIREATPPAACDAEDVYRWLARGALRLAAKSRISAFDSDAGAVTALQKAATSIRQGRNSPVVGHLSRSTSRDWANCAVRKARLSLPANCLKNCQEKNGVGVEGGLPRLCAGLLRTRKDHGIHATGMFGSVIG